MQVHRDHPEPEQNPDQPKEPDLAIAIMFLTAVMVGCIFVVCRLLGQLDDLTKNDDQKCLGDTLRASQLLELSVSGQELGNNQATPPPAVLNQCWMESGIVISVLKNSIQAHELRFSSI